MADLWQGGRILVGLLEAVTWPEAPSEPVLTGGAVVSEDESGNLLSDPPAGITPDGPPDLPTPFARVSRVRWRRDAEQQGRYEEVVYRVFVTAGSGGITNTAGTVGDTHGIEREEGLLRNAVQGQGNSDGRTADEVVSQLIASIGGTNGMLVPSLHSLQGSFEESGVKDAEDASEIQTASFDVVVTNGTVLRVYDPPACVQAAANGGGQVTVTWVNPPTRYDTYTNVVRRSANGGTAPVLITDGTPCSLSAPLAASFVDTGLTPGAKYFYTAFHLYSEVTVGDRNSTGNASGQVTVS